MGKGKGTAKRRVLMQIKDKGRCSLPIRFLREMGADVGDVLDITVERVIKAEKTSDDLEDKI